MQNVPRPALSERFHERHRTLYARRWQAKEDNIGHIHFAVSTKTIGPLRKNRPNMTIDDALTCQEVVELVTEYLENVLLPETRKRLEEHVAECPGCVTYIEQVRLTIGMLRQLAEEPVFPTTKQELLRRFRNRKKDASSQKPDSL